MWVESHFPRESGLKRPGLGLCRRKGSQQGGVLFPVSLTHCPPPPHRGSCLSKDGPAHSGSVRSTAETGVRVGELGLWPRSWERAGDEAHGEGGGGPRLGCTTRSHQDTCGPGCGPCSFRGGACLFCGCLSNTIGWCVCVLGGGGKGGDRMQHKHMGPQVCRPEAPDPSASRAALPREAPAEGPSCLFRFSQLPVAPGIPWLVGASPQSLPLYSHTLLPSLRALLPLFLRAHWSCWIYGPSW